MWKLIQSVIKSIARAIAEDPEIKRFIKAHPQLAAFVCKHLSPYERSGIYLTVGIVIAAIFLFFFFAIVEDLIAQDPLVRVDYRVVTLVQIFRTPAFNNIMLFITYLGSWQIVLAAMFLSGIVLSLVKRWYELAMLVISVVGGGIFVVLVKLIVHRPRPTLVNALASEQSFSFPSGHSFVAIVFYGLLAYLLVRALRASSVRFFVVSVAVCLVVAIGFSRIYLGVHWPSDVLASYAAGAAWLVLTITALEIRRRFGVSRSVAHLSRRVIVAIGVILFFAWGLFVAYFFNAHPLRPADSVTRKMVTVTPQNIAENLFATLPKMSEDIVGEPMEPFNLIIVATQKDLDQTLQKAGWFLADPVTLSSFIRLVIRSALDEPYSQAPAAPSFWNGWPNEISYEKPTPRNSVRERHHIHLWKTPFVLGDGRRVYFATAHFDRNIALFSESFFLPFHAIDPAVDKEREAIKEDLLKTSNVESVQIFRIIEPTLGKNMAGDRFFTDGISYIVFLRNSQP